MIAGAPAEGPFGRGTFSGPPEAAGVSPPPSPTSDTPAEPFPTGFDPEKFVNELLMFAPASEGTTGRCPSIPTEPAVPPGTARAGHFGEGTGAAQ